jgi:hypothetical protein
MKNVLHSAHDEAGLIGILGFRVQEESQILA